MSRVSPAWLLVFAAAWWALAAAPAWHAWLAGAVAVLGGSLSHTLLGGRGAASLRLGGLLRFCPYFLVLAVRGGLDVARRALAPELRLAPGLLRYRIRLPDGAPRVLFVNSISLLPGTFSAELAERDLLVHLLARDAGDERRIGELEERVAGLFGIALAARGDDA